MVFLKDKIWNFHPPCVSHARPAKDQSYAMIITRYQLQRTPASHMNILCYGVDITLMDTVSV